MDPMENQLCRVCEEKAAGFHFGAFTCEGCKSFFGRFCNNQTNIPDCKNSFKCVIDKRNRTSCKACRLRKCLSVGMSKSGCRYGRRSNWFKIHCLMQKNAEKSVKQEPSVHSAPSSLPTLINRPTNLSYSSLFTSPALPSSPSLALPPHSPSSCSRSPSPLNTSSETSFSSSSPSPPHFPSSYLPFTPFQPQPFLLDPLAFYRLSPLLALQPLLQKSSDFHEQLRLLAERRALFEASCTASQSHEESNPIDLSVK